MFDDDHASPPLHALYGNAEAQIGISPIRVLRGALPHRALSLVLEWMALHQNELLRNWELAAQEQPLQAIEPLE